MVWSNLNFAQSPSAPGRNSRITIDEENKCVRLGRYLLNALQVGLREFGVLWLSYEMMRPKAFIEAENSAY